MLAKKYVQKSIETKQKILSSDIILNIVNKIADEIIKVYRHGNKVIFVGNGGSAADAQHLAAELVSKFYFERKALDAVALTTNTSILTAIANDYDFENVFSRQLEACGKKGDLLFSISTSGSSKNVILAIKTAKKIGMKSISFTGEMESEMSELSDITLKIPSDETPIIQESHIMLGHVICAIVESSLIKK